MVMLTLTYVSEFTSTGTLGLLVICVGMPKTPIVFMANINHMLTKTAVLTYSLSLGIIAFITHAGGLSGWTAVVEQSSRLTASLPLEHLQFPFGTVQCALNTSSSKEYHYWPVITRYWVCHTWERGRSVYSDFLCVRGWNTEYRPSWYLFFISF